MYAHRGSALLSILSILRFTPSASFNMSLHAHQLFVSNNNNTAVVSSVPRPIVIVIVIVIVILVIVILVIVLVV